MFFFFKDISQFKLIDQVNKYFKKSQSHIAFNESGICNGLVLLGIEYFLLNQKEQFFADLQQCVQKPDEALSMIVRLMILFKPQNFFLDFSQQQSYQLFKEPTKPTFSFGKVMKDKQWITFFLILKLREDEVAAIASLDHIVYLTRQGQNYELYDPDESSGVITKKNEKSLVNALKNAFQYNSLMAMTIQVFQRAGEKINSREKKSFYELTQDKLTKEKNGQSYSSLDLAIRVDDSNYLEYCSDEITQDVLKKAIAYKADKMVEVMLESYADKFSIDNDFRMEIIFFSLTSGSYKIFNDLLKKEGYKNIMKDKDIGLIKCALSGKHPELFEQILLLCDSSVVNDLKSRLSNGELWATRLLIHALNNKQHQNLNLLIDFYKSKQIILNEYEVNRLIIAAIFTNDIYNLLKIVEVYQPKNLQYLKLDIFTIYEFSPALIKELQAKGVSLSFWQKCCLQSKDNMLLSIFFCLAIYAMYLYHWVNNLPTKSIHFEPIPQDPEKLQGLLEQLNRLQDVCEVFRKRPKTNPSNDENKPLLNGPHPN